MGMHARRPLTRTPARAGPAPPAPMPAAPAALAAGEGTQCAPGRPFNRASPDEGVPVNKTARVQPLPQPRQSREIRTCQLQRLANVKASAIPAQTPPASCRQRRGVRRARHRPVSLLSAILVSCDFFRKCGREQAAFPTGPGSALPQVAQSHLTTQRSLAAAGLASGRALVPARRQ
jgi:hypothetical protein